MFWICAENRVDLFSGMKHRDVQLLLIRAHTEWRPFLLLTPPLQGAGWGYTRGWEGTRPGELTPTDQRDIPCHMASCSACKAEGKKEERGGHSETWHFSSQITVTCDGALVSWGCLSTCC